jgi:hypothetical protein
MNATPNRALQRTSPASLSLRSIGVAAPILTRSLTITLLSMSFLFGCFKKGAGSPPSSKFTELAKDDVTRMDQQRAVVATAAKQRYGTPGLTKTKADAAVLQRLLDDKAFSKTQTYELQCLGVVLGDVLASEFPLRWVMVTDEYGTDPTLRFRDTTIQINALTMIYKRVERNDAVTVSWFIDKTRDQLAELGGKAD